MVMNDEKGNFKYPECKQKKTLHLVAKPRVYELFSRVMQK